MIPHFKILVCSLCPPQPASTLTNQPLHLPSRRFQRTRPRKPPRDRRALTAHPITHHPRQPCRNHPSLRPPPRHPIPSAQALHPDRVVLLIVSQRQNHLR